MLLILTIMDDLSILRCHSSRGVRQIASRKIPRTHRRTWDLAFGVEGFESGAAGLGLMRAEG